MSRNGPASFKGSGTMYRRLGPMLQQQGSTNPGYMQTYFHDPDYQGSHRATRNGQSSLPPRELEMKIVIFGLYRTSLQETATIPT